MDLYALGTFAVVGGAIALVIWALNRSNGRIWGAISLILFLIASVSAILVIAPNVINTWYDSGSNTTNVIMDKVQRVVPAVDMNVPQGDVLDPQDILGGQAPSTAPGGGVTVPALPVPGDVRWGGENLPDVMSSTTVEQAKLCLSRDQLYAYAWEGTFLSGYTYKVWTSAAFWKKWISKEQYVFSITSNNPALPQFNEVTVDEATGMHLAEKFGDGATGTSYWPRPQEVLQADGVTWQVSQPVQCGFPGN